MKIKVDGADIQIDFWYEPDYVHPYGKGVTRARLMIGSTPVVGSAYCSSKDKFNRHVGRKIALAHLLKMSYPGADGKPTRTAIWKELAAKGMRLRR